MIFGDNVEQLALILPEAAEFICRALEEGVEDGRYELGNGHYANVMTYTNKAADQAVFEAHEKYADIQMVIEGEEIMWVTDLEALEVTKPYDAEADYLLLNYKPGDDASREETNAVPMLPGGFCLVMPEDAHAPGIAVDQPAQVRKVVVKMAL